LNNKISRAAFDEKAARLILSHGREFVYNDKGKFLYKINLPNTLSVNAPVSKTFIALGAPTPRGGNCNELSNMMIILMIR